MVILGFFLIALALFIPVIMLIAAFLGFDGVAALASLLCKIVSPILLIVGVILMVRGARGPGAHGTT